MYRELLVAAIEDMMVKNAGQSLDAIAHVLIKQAASTRADLLIKIALNPALKKLLTPLSKIFTRSPAPGNVVKRLAPSKVDDVYRAVRKLSPEVVKRNANTGSKIPSMLGGVPENQYLKSLIESQHTGGSMDDLTKLINTKYVNARKVQAGGSLLPGNPGAMKYKPYHDIQDVLKKDFTRTSEGYMSNTGSNFVPFDSIKRQGSIIKGQNNNLGSFKGSYGETVPSSFLESIMTNR